ncbi:hypothetical protein [Legionella oakridgensis]|uniref:Uncharacterized protein n=2 Tax=Legionella oakridgensis TaxID=29423 RepID=W0BCP8_9GAMM|nr:hypothetical protein [Legionella oakridgensis]AHE66194.1 hypothetical protein Loa_00625 [Legionella oakridgensis ATCC 33761 = DSM 21215]KTD42337.1 hypothetical protein Loak_0763 [Legionella oakridgensis]STY16101.1 Uncharacterised protein [Legionella longbeachae]
MPLLSREQFVKLCTEAILYTRNTITINNQISGYKKFHREIKENHYFFANVRASLIDTREHEYMYRHDLLAHVGLGHCHELADFLLVEIGKALELKGAFARIRIVRSVKYDHVYLEIKIQLKDEKDYSYWEVDAWDPRVIDISTRPDGSIKNHEALEYGYSADVKNSVYSDEINYQQRFTFFGGIPKPLPGAPNGRATPEAEMLDKHAEMYSDYTMEEAMENGKLDPSGQIHYLQEVSKWQLSSH